MVRVITGVRNVIAPNTALATQRREPELRQQRAAAARVAHVERAVRGGALGAEDDARPPGEDGASLAHQGRRRRLLLLLLRRCERL